MPTVGQQIAAVTPERFAAGMTFEAYLDYIATPANLAREGSDGYPRSDQSAWLRAWYESLALTEAQAGAMRWLAAQPNGPARVLVLSEEWSSDCRRDVPVFQRLAEAGTLELRVFNRDGQRFGRGAHPSLEEAPDSNADLMAKFLNEKRGERFQSIPVAAFFTSASDGGMGRYLYHFVEHAAIYDKDRWVYEHMRQPRPGESAEETRVRASREMADLVASPFFRVWASAAADEIVSALYERAVLGLPA